MSGTPLREPGRPEQITAQIRRLLAPNPSPMTERGTNTYLVGTGPVAVIDPGPDDPRHLAAILGASGGAVSHILVTHSHRDHSTLAPRLAAETGAPVYAYGDSLAGRSATMDRLAAEGLAGGGEGVDAAFSPDRRLKDGATLTGAGWELTALWTPGHMGNHLCFAMGDVTFTGDLVMGWSTSLVSPPDGDLGAFLASCARLSARQNRLFLPGHGAAIEDPAARLRTLIDHRNARTEQILSALAAAPATIAQLTGMIYHDVPPALHPAAARNVFAHLIQLAEAGRVTATPALSDTALFALSDAAHDASEM